MLTEAYIGALLVDGELADLVWALWDQGEIDNVLALIAWVLIRPLTTQNRRLRNLYEMHTVHNVSAQNPYQTHIRIKG